MAYTDRAAYRADYKRRYGIPYGQPKVHYQSFGAAPGTKVYCGARVSKPWQRHPNADPDKITCNNCRRRLGFPLLGDPSVRLDTQPEPAIEIDADAMTYPPNGDPVAKHDHGDTVLPECWNRLIGLATLRQNILMVGPTGCGKTHIAKTLADELDLPFAGISCSAGMSESQLSGWLLPRNRDEWKHRASPFVRCYEDGGVFLFDEIDAADENTLVFVNQALANDGFVIPQRDKGADYVKKHPDFVCIAAANTFGHGASVMYAGRNALDGATLDRFRTGVIDMDYSGRVEQKIIAREVLIWGRRIRRSIREHGFNREMSTRTMLGFSEQYVKLGWGRQQWEASYFADWTDEEKEAVQ